MKRSATGVGERDDNGVAADPPVVEGNTTLSGLILSWEDGAVAGPESETI